MGVPLGTSFDVAEASPVDSRMTWTGSAANLNQIAANGANRYPGLITYVTGDQNLYVFQGNNIWEKIVTTNIDSPSIITNTLFNISSDFNGQVIGVNNSSLITARLLDPVSTYPDGFNVTFIQLGAGSIKFEPPTTSIDPPIIRNRLNLNTTAGIYAVVSMLRFAKSNNFFLYGDLI